jgi:hypothetical protein
MGTQLGLRDLVANKYDNFNKLSTLPPRMIPVPTSLIEQEEKIRAYWMTEVLDSMSSLGAGWNLSLSRPENEAFLPCNETVWAFVCISSEHFIPLFARFTKFNTLFECFGSSGSSKRSIKLAKRLEIL